jgi:hypothetical protein
MAWSARLNRPMRNGVRHRLNSARALTRRRLAKWPPRSNAWRVRVAPQPDQTAPDAAISNIKQIPGQPESTGSLAPGHIEESF